MTRKGSSEIRKRKENVKRKNRKGKKTKVKVKKERKKIIIFRKVLTRSKSRQNNKKCAW